MQINEKQVIQVTNAFTVRRVNYLVTYNDHRNSTTTCQLTLEIALTSKLHEQLDHEVGAEAGALLDVVETGSGPEPRPALGAAAKPLLQHRQHQVVDAVKREAGACSDSSSAVRAH